MFGKERSENRVPARWAVAALAVCVAAVGNAPVSAQTSSSSQTRRAADYAGPAKNLADGVATSLRADFPVKPTRLGTGPAVPAAADQMLPSGCTSGWLPTEVEAFAEATAETKSQMRLATSKKPVLRIVPSRARMDELDELNALDQAGRQRFGIQQRQLVAAAKERRHPTAISTGCPRCLELARTTGFAQHRVEHR